MSEIAGKVIVKGETKTFGNNGFRKREFVIETSGQYPQKIQIELIQDKCDLLNSIEKGDTIKVAYNLNGRDWVNPQGETKFFNSVQAWRIDKIDANSQPEQPKQEQNNISDEEDDSLPF